MMFDLIKQSLYLGMAFASLTREKLAELGKEISTRAQLSQEQTQQFQEELAHKAAEARRDLESDIDRRIDHAFIQLGIVKSGLVKVSEQARHELEALIEERLDKLLASLKVARCEDVEALRSRVEIA
ncbi:MAG: hypothetical protein ACKV2Q_35575 [Planctomycetaceae bacterium]